MRATRGQFVVTRWRASLRPVLTAVLIVAVLALVVLRGDAQGGTNSVGTPSAPRVGLDRDSPALPGEEAITAGYGVTLLGAIQGPEATDRLREAGDLPPASLPGEEYVLVEVRVRNRSRSSARLPISAVNFGLTASAARL